MAAEERGRMLAATFDTVLADAEGSHGWCFRLLTERKTGLYVLDVEAVRLVRDDRGWLRQAS
jgi:hypothetical protein